MDIPSTVAIIGGGLAGLSAAIPLAKAGHTVTIYEARAKLGGRAGSFTDAATGQVIDACQHVGMGCCTSLKQFWKDLGVDHLFERQSVLHFITLDRKQSRFQADPWPAPLHLGRALTSAHYLSLADKARIAWGLIALMREPPQADPPLLPWLLNHHQNETTIRKFWGVVLTSALNESVANLGVKYARKVFRDGFLASRDGWEVEIPSVPLGQLYGEEMGRRFAAMGITIECNAALKHLEALTNPSGFQLTFRDGRTVTTPAVILALPFQHLLPVLPADLQTNPFFASIAKLTPSPITSVHVWYDRPVMALPHVVIIDGAGHWVFNRGEVAPGEYYVQVVASASRELRLLGKDETAELILKELHTLFPAVRYARVIRTKVITEVAATFAAVPGVDAFRPLQRTPVPGLALAGDWTATGWPATMEGAVRSGALAAQALLQ